MIKEPYEWKILFRLLFGTDQVINLLGLFPTRWYIRSNSILRAFAGYEVVSVILKALKDYH